MYMYCTSTVAWSTYFESTFLLRLTKIVTPTIQQYSKRVFPGNFCTHELTTNFKSGLHGQLLSMVMVHLTVSSLATVGVKTWTVAMSRCVTRRPSVKQ